jgi:hypothetical protein
MEKEIKPLPEEFKTNGLHYKLLKRINDYALVIVRGPNGGPICGYEVHKIRVMIIPPKWITGKLIGFTHMEKYATNEDFGGYGWSYATLDQAKKDFPIFKEVISNDI